MHNLPKSLSADVCFVLCCVYFRSPKSNYLVGKSNVTGKRTANSQSHIFLLHLAVFIKWKENHSPDAYFFSRSLANWTKIDYRALSDFKFFFTSKIKKFNVEYDWNSNNSPIRKKRSRVLGKDSKFVAKFEQKKGALPEIAFLSKFSQNSEKN